MRQALALPPTSAALVPRTRSSWCANGRRGPSRVLLRCRLVPFRSQSAPIWLSSVSPLCKHRDNRATASRRFHHCHENIARCRSTRRNERAHADIRRAQQATLAVGIPFVLIRQELERVRRRRHFPITVGNVHGLGTREQMARIDEYAWLRIPAFDPGDEFGWKFLSERHTE